MKALRKALDVLSLIAAGRGATARELSERLGLPRSTVHRMLAEMLELGVIERETVGEGFTIGPALTRLLGSRNGRERLLRVAHPVMVALRDRCRETVSLHTIEAGRRVLLHQVESSHEHRWVYTNPGQYMPLHAGAASKMLLALLPEAEARACLRRAPLQAFTAHTPRNRERLLRELRRARRAGYAISAEEVTPGIASIAVPVETGDESLRVVMSVTGPMVRLTVPALHALLPLLREAAAAVARQLAGAGRARGRRPVPAGAGR